VTVTVPITATSEIIRLGHGLEQAEAIIDIRLDFQPATTTPACSPNQSTPA